MNIVELRKPSLVHDGTQILSHSSVAFELAAEVERLLIEKGIVSQKVELSELHEYVSLKNLQVDEHFMNPVNTSFYETSDLFRKLYFDLISYIAKEIFEFDFIFQETPNVRFLFPTGHEKRSEKLVGLPGQHSDTMLGHSFEEINCWLPITDCYGSNSLLLSDLETGIQVLSKVMDDLDWDLDRYFLEGRDYYRRKVSVDEGISLLIDKHTKPLKLKVGDFVAFDTRCLHGSPLNKEGSTRVSIDFRIIPLHRYKLLTRSYRSNGRTRRRFMRGDVFYETSARDLGAI